MIHPLDATPMQSEEAMSKELIERLRGSPRNTSVGKLDHEAADRIDELERENKRLSDDHYFQACLTRDLMPYQERAIKAEQKCDALQADNARLRKALKLATTYHEKKCDCAGCKALAKVRKP